MAKQDASDFPAGDIVFMDRGDGNTALLHLHGRYLSLSTSIGYNIKVVYSVNMLHYISLSFVNLCVRNPQK